MKTPKPITDTELAVLKVLWDRGPLRARFIATALYSTCTPSDIGTVHSMLQRLETKRLVTRDRSTHPHVFSAGASRAQVAGQQLELMADKLADGSLVPFLAHLIQADRLSQEDLDELRALLDEQPRETKIGR